MPAPVTKLTTKACTLFGQTPSVPAKGQRRRLLRGANRLQKAIAHVSRAVGGGKLSGSCAAAYVSDLMVARDRARQVAGTR
jgi:ribosomal protein S30